MSKHTNKYYQLIKVIRNEKQYANMQRALRQHRQKLKIDQDHLQLNQQLIADIIDHDHSIEMEHKDRNVAGNQDNLETVRLECERLWLDFCQKRAKNQSMLPVQKKLSKMKDQARIQRIIDRQQQTKGANTEKIQELSQKIKSQSFQLDSLKQTLDRHKLQLDNCDGQLTKLKIDFDNEQKGISQRSNKFKEQKSKDIMYKNIDREDNQMRNAMISRIKLNQELDLGFTLQRRRAFNQAKQAVNDKKKKSNDSYTKIKAAYDHKTQQKEKLQLQKSSLEERNKQIEQQIAYFLKQLIRHFQDHSRGIKWMVNKLLQLNQTVSADIFPENIYTQDKEFLQLLFRDTGKSTPKAKGKSKSSMFFSTPNASPKQKLKMFHSFKTQTDLLHENQSKILTKTGSNQPYERNGKKKSVTKVHFDAQNDPGDQIESSKWRSDPRKFNITSPSLKKIYESTGEMISGLIRRKEWNYQSCKAIASRGIEQSEEHNSPNHKQIEGKLKQKFLHIRQHVRRNQLKRFIFGEVQRK